MHRSKRSLYNALTALLFTISNSLLGLIVTRVVLLHFGSDFNGLNSTATQLVRILMIVESGFTIATNVALFKPTVESQTDEINAIVAATKIIFRRIALIFFGAGIVVCGVCALFIRSSLGRTLVFYVLMMAIIPYAADFFFSTKYRIILQSQQKEYIISLITMCTLTAGNLVIIWLIYHGGQMWSIRFTTMAFALLGCVIIAVYCRRDTKFLNLKVKPNFSAIQGTKDIFVQKITGVFYNTMPILYIAVASQHGTKMASVYGVYSSAFYIIKSTLYSFTDAPRLGLGQVLHEKERPYVYEVFRQYEMMVFTILFILLSAMAVMIMPFITLYSFSVNDINYRDTTIALLMIVTTIFEIIRIPSEHLINMSGNFRTGRNVQIVACVSLVVGMIIGGTQFEIYGILSAMLFTAVLMAVLQMGFSHLRFFRGKIPGLLSLLRTLLPPIAFCTLLVLVEQRLLPGIHSYASFALTGLIVCAVNAALVLSFSFLVNRQLTMRMMGTLTTTARKILHWEK